MIKKWLILGLAWLLVACGTRDEVAAATPIPPSYTPTPTVTPVPPTQTPTRLYATITRQPTVTYTPSPTPTPTATPIPLPSAHLLFRRDDQLWDWFPTTNETTLLIDGFRWLPRNTGDTIFAVQEIASDDTLAIHALYLPTRNEQEIISPIRNIRDLSLSPNQHWLAVATNPDMNTLIVFVYALSYDEMGNIQAEKTYTSQHGRQNSFPLRDLLWVSANEVSWSTDEGIWSVDLSQVNPTPQVVILPSTNQFEMGSLASPEAEPSLINTRYIPYQWSPDGRYLLVVEYFYEHGQFRVIDRITGNSFVLPGSGVGPISDEALWINETQLVYLDLQGEISLWEITPEDETLMTKVKSTALPGQYNGIFDALWLDPMGQLRFRLNNSDLMVWDVVTGELSLLKEFTPPTSNVPNIFWSPDGNWILSVANEVVLIGLDDQEPIYLDAILGDYWGYYWQWYSYPTEVEIP